MKKNLPLYGVLLALAFVLSYVEALMPFSLGIPGVKLGLANLVTLVALYLLPAPGAAAIALCRILLAGFTFGSMSSMLYALCGGVLSFLVMWLCKKLPCFSPVGVSVAGGVSHNIGQLACAVVVMQTVGLSWYLPVLLLSGTVAGVVIGVLGGLVVRRLDSGTVNKSLDLSEENPNDNTVVVDVKTKDGNNVIDLEEDFEVTTSEPNVPGT